jgi:hypothetical protein
VVKPQVDVQHRWARLGLRPWCWHWDLVWLDCSATLLGAVALRISTWCMAVLSVPSTASVCRW